MDKKLRFANVERVKPVEEPGTYDVVGGYHHEGIGWRPDGEWCGECCRSTCEECPTWLKQTKKQ